MAELIVKYPDRAAEHFQINRLRVTIGRSARNDLCIPDPFASRVHAEVRNEGDEYFLQSAGWTWRIAVASTAAIIAAFFGANQSNAFIYFQF